MSEVTSEVQNVNEDDVFFNDSRLFKLQTLFEFNTKKCTFCENGRKKVFAGVSDDSFYFFLMDADEKKSSKEIPWDSKKFPIIDLCFDPSGTWLLVLSTATLQIVPVLPLLQPDVKHDLKWPTDKITTVTLNPNHAKNPNAIVWWQTKESQQIAIIGDKAGDLIFFSLENLEIIGKTCIVGGVHKLTIFVDDSLDNITLLITSSKNRQWKLTLEQRNCQYNWVLGKKEQRKSKEINKKLDGFIASIKELGSDKMSTLFQMKSHSVSDVPNKLSTPVSRYNPTPLSLENFQDANYSKCQEKGELSSTYGGVNMSQWMLNPQSADGRHFISLFNSVHGTFTLQLDIEDHKPVFTYRLEGLPTDIQSIIWQQRIIFTFGYTVIQIHSSALATQQDSNIHTLIWEDDLGDGEQVVAAWGFSNSSTFPPYTGKWTDTTEIDKLDLPRFSLDSCLVVTNKKTFLLTTRCDPCEWLVAQLVSGRRGVERTAAALKVCLPPLLLAAADILLTRGNVAQALPLYKLAKVSPDEPLNRLAALGMYNEMLASGFVPQSISTGNICFISHVLTTVVNHMDDSSLITFIQNNTFFSVSECLTLCADLGLWNAISTIAFGKGMLWLSFQSLVYRFISPCRGLWAALLKKQYSPFVITEASIPLLKYIEQYCETFDNVLLKELCIWMCPLQDCFNVIFKALATSQPNAHLSGMRRLIRTFFGVLSTLYSRISIPLPQIILPRDVNCHVTEVGASKDDPASTSPRTWAPLTLSSGHSHWGITHQGKACIKNAEGAAGFMNIDLEIMGKAIGVSCGRHHTLLLTENGVYSLGDNHFGQLGVGPDISCCLDSFILVGIMGRKIPPRSHSKKNVFSWINENVTQVVAGQYHSACVTDQGSLYTWGWGVHGQLAHGTIFNHLIPKKVTTLKTEKVKSVGCGACHTAILTETGRVFLCGSGTFGQIGHSNRHKCNFPFEINLGLNHVVQIAVGYFHTLALTDNEELWVWGSSPQSLRVGARGARRSRPTPGKEAIEGGESSQQSLPSPTAVEENPHLYPTKVNLSEVKGKVVKMSAGWHHSCIVDQFGSLYVWGLNLDGQLGTGDQKEILNPTLIDLTVKTVEDKKPSPPKDISITLPITQAAYRHNRGCKQYTADNSAAKVETKAVECLEMCNGDMASVACGGDFTIFLNSQGKLHIAGNSYQQFQDTTVKGTLRVVKMKNTKRILRLPNPRPAAQRTFRQFGLPNNFMEQSYMSTNNPVYKQLSNPITSMEDFKNPLWAHNIILHLHQFVDDDTPLVDIHLRAQLAVLRKDYAEALNLQLNALVADTSVPNTPTFQQHTGVLQNVFHKRMTAQKILLENIKKLSRNLLDSEYKESVSEILCCQCDETSYLVDSSIIEPSKGETKDISTNAISIIKSMLDLLPPSTAMWTECVNQATMFWIDHELNMNDLEHVFSEVVKDGHVIDMASAIFCTNDNIDYQKHLSPVFNLELCDNILNFW